MNVDYTWDIISIKKGTVNGLENVVVGVNWKLTGVAGEFEGEVYGYVDLADPAPENFTSWEQLTREQVVAWVESSLSADQHTVLQAELQTQIYPLQNQVVEVQEFPWSE
jgi:hypothetical protein